MSGKGCTVDACRRKLNGPFRLLLFQLHFQRLESLDHELVRLKLNMKAVGFLLNFNKSKLYHSRPTQLTRPYLWHHVRHKSNVWIDRMLALKTFLCSWLSPDDPNHFAHFGNTWKNVCNIARFSCISLLQRDPLEISALVLETSQDVN